MCIYSQPESAVGTTLMIIVKLNRDIERGIFISISIFNESDRLGLIAKKIRSFGSKRLFDWPDLVKEQSCSRGLLLFM